MPLSKIVRSRHEFLAAVAEDVWRTFSGEVPVFLDSIVQDNGLTMSYGDYGDAFEGLIEHRSGKFHVYINTARTPAGSPRSRFTLGHELGHFFIDEHRNALAAGQSPHPSFPNRPTENLAEQEANLFSSHLLMPAKEYDTRLKLLKGGLQSVRDIASTFQVSVQCSALRYVVSSCRPCAVIMFRDGAKPWWGVSTELEAKGLTWLRDLDRQFPGDFATAQAMATDPKKPIVIFSNSTVASFWFGNVAPSGPRNIVMWEESMRLGQHGVLTLLSVR